jgi:hypothetical protein
MRIHLVAKPLAEESLSVTASGCSGRHPPRIQRKAAEMRKLGLTFVLLLAGLVPAAALAGGDDDDAVKVVSGAGTELSRDGGATWRPAVVVPAAPARAPPESWPRV